MEKALYPLKLLPVYKERIWGGRNLSRVLNKRLPDGMLVGESWEIGDDSVVAEGLLSGRTLIGLAHEFAEALLGKRVVDRYGKVIPLLVKFIDAQDRLSVQVHPDDSFAQSEGFLFGKTEMWYVLEAAQGAEVIHGIATEDLTPMSLAQFARDGRIVNHLSHVAVKAGDALFIPAGTIHAIGAGLLICEVQQNSDLTYRLYDWDRRGSNGQPRELHVEKAASVSCHGPREHILSKLVTEEPWGRRELLAACRYFATEVLWLQTLLTLTADGGSLCGLCALSGRGEIRWSGGSLTVETGESVVIPAAASWYELAPDGHWQVLRTWVPDLAEMVANLVAAGISREAIVNLGGPFESNDLIGLVEQC